MLELFPAVEYEGRLLTHDVQSFVLLVGTPTVVASALNGAYNSHLECSNEPGALTFIRRFKTSNSVSQLMMMC